jgi:hypothetical protein
MREENNANVCGVKKSERVVLLRRDSFWYLFFVEMH